MMREAPPYWYPQADRLKLAGLGVLLVALVVTLIAAPRSAPPQVAAQLGLFAAATEQPAAGVGQEQGTAAPALPSPSPTASAPTATPLTGETMTGAATPTTATEPVATEPTATATATHRATPTTEGRAAAPVIAGLTPGVPVPSSTVPELTGTAAPGARVIVFDGARQVGATTADENGNWRLELPQLAPGKHGLRIQVMDEEGKVAAASGVTAVTVAEATPITPEAGAPEVSATEAGATETPAPETDVKEADATAAPTASAGTPPRVSEPVVPAFTPGVPLPPDALGDVNGAAQPGERLSLYDGATRIGETEADAAGHWAIPLPPLASGPHALSVQAMRPDGSIAGASGMTLIEVAEGAQTPAPTPTPAPLPRVGTPVVPGLKPGRPMAPGDVKELTGVAQAGDIVRLYDGATRIGETEADAAGHWRVPLDGLKTGVHGLWAQVVGPDGKVIATSPLTVLTLAEPKVKSAAAPRKSKVTMSRPRRQVAAPVVGAAGEITGVAEPGETLQVYDGARSIGKVVADAGGNWRFALPALAPGFHGLWVQIADERGKSVAASPMTAVRVVAADPP